MGKLRTLTFTSETATLHLQGYTRVGVTLENSAGEQSQLKVEAKVNPDGGWDDVSSGLGVAQTTDQVFHLVLIDRPWESVRFTRIAPSGGSMTGYARLEG